MKRLLDFLLSSIGLLVITPLFLILLLITVLSSPGAPFFCGERVGKDGNTFRIIKFRSMVKDSEGHGKWNVGSNDPRVTKWGRFLRKTKMDEIPQLLNVIAGHMSLVGPRPELKVYTNMYTEEEKCILDNRPGITDWASIANIDQYKVFTAAEDPDEAYLRVVRPLKLKLQLYYHDQHTLWMDFQILVLTVLKVLVRFKKLPKGPQRIIDEHLLELEQPNDK